MSGSENNGGLSPDEFGFKWVDREDELSPEDEELLKEYSVPIGRPPRRMAEMVYGELAEEAQERLQELRVDGYAKVDKSWIKEIPELLMNPSILDDVHYVIYQGRKKQPLYSRFVSVSAREIFLELYGMKEDCINGAVLQSKQTSEAFKFLAKDLGMDEISIYEAMRKGAEGSFALRSLHRLLGEKNMEGFCKIILKATEERADEAPITFEEVANRAVRYINNKHSRIANWNTADLSTDQRTVHSLVLRDLERSQAFAKPVADFLGRHIETNEQNG